MSIAWLDWPGVNSAWAILEDKPSQGLLVRPHARVCRAQRGEEYSRLTYATEEEVVLTPLPCWAHLTPEQYRERVAGLVEEIEAEAQAERVRRQIPALGVQTILKQTPQAQPKASKRSPAPRFHAATKAVRQALWEAYCAFVAAFREAAERLKEGDRLARFPMGSFPPGLPFVSSCPSLPP